MTTLSNLQKMTIRLLLSFIIIATLGSCANMPTSSTQITGAYTSSIKYENYSLERLQVELDALSRRESQLVIAKEQRVKSSQAQAFLLGYGQGDGIEASELAQVRGEKEAVIKAIEVKKSQK